MSRTKNNDPRDMAYILIAQFNFDMVEAGNFANTAYITMSGKDNQRFWVDVVQEICYAKHQEATKMLKHAAYDIRREYDNDTADFLHKCYTTVKAERDSMLEVLR